MASLPRAALLGALAALLGIALAIAEPSPPAAEADIPCDIAGAVPGSVTDAFGLGNPAADICNALPAPGFGLTGKALDPLKDVAGSIGDGIFAQITTWVAEGAAWLLVEVAKLTSSTTSPDLLSDGFLSQYRKMALIAALMAALMSLFAVMEAVARGDLGMLVRVFVVNVPLAALATTIAYVLVQLLLTATDGLCQAIAATTRADTEEFFESAINGLTRAGIGFGEAAEGASERTVRPETAAVPLFVGFIAAFLAAIAACFVWVELLMRDAAVYVVALFAPLALAAAIWPRWGSALRRACELLVVIVFSKFVIVAIIALAASLLADGEGGVEQVLAAGALLLLACFSPLVLMRLVPFAEGAIAAAHTRKSPTGAVASGARLASSAQTMSRSAFGNWDSGVRTPAPRRNPQGGGGSTGGVGGGQRSAAGAPDAGRAAARSGGGAGGAGGAAAGGAAGGGAAVGLALAAPGAAAGAARAAARRLGGSGVAEAGAEAGASAPSGNESPKGTRSRPAESGPARPGGGAVEPKAATGGESGGGEAPRRPRPEIGTTGSESREKG